MKNVGILIFDDVEVLDFCGPFEVFSVASQLNNNNLFNVFTVAKDKREINTINGLSVNPKYTFQEAPPIDILIISGGSGTKMAMEDTKLMEFVINTQKNAEITMSICSGSRILGTLGLLDKLIFTTHHQVFDDMKTIAPLAIPEPNKRFIDTGNIITSGGISAGIDVSFYVVEKLFGNKVALDTAQYMEYEIRP